MRFVTATWPPLFRLTACISQYQIRGPEELAYSIRKIFSLRRVFQVSRVDFSRRPPASQPEPLDAHPKFPSKLPQTSEEGGVTTGNKEFHYCIIHWQEQDWCVSRPRSLNSHPRKSQQLFIRQSQTSKYPYPTAITPYALHLVNKEIW